MANHEQGRLPEPDERQTPDQLFAPLHLQHRFTLDGAAAHDNTKLSRYHTKTQLMNCGNVRTWKGERVWCNPPYSDITPWIVRAWEDGAQLAYLLVPNWTDRKWWLELVEPYRDGKDAKGEAPMQLDTTFFPRHRFLYKGEPIRTKKGGIGQPEFGLVGLLFRQKGIK